MKRDFGPVVPGVTLRCLMIRVKKESTMLLYEGKTPKGFIKDKLRKVERAELHRQLRRERNTEDVTEFAPPQDLNNLFPDLLIFRGNGAYHVRVK